MQRNLRSFWQRLQTGVEVAVANPTPDKLLGVRDGFRRYFEQALGRAIPVVVVPQKGEDRALGLVVSDEQVVARARGRAKAMKERLGESYHFYVCTEGGLACLEIEDEVRYFVRNWTVVVSPVGEAWGASGSVQLPERLIAGLEHHEIALAVPGTRRRGGMFSSLTGGLENRRRATGLSTLCSLSSLFYGVLEAKRP